MLSIEGLMGFHFQFGRVGTVFCQRMGFWGSIIIAPQHLYGLGLMPRELLVIASALVR